MAPMVESRPMPNDTEQRSVRRTSTAAAPLLLALAPVLLALVAGLAGACGPTEEDTGRYEAQIEEDLRAYMPVLERAYRERDPSVLEPLAAEKERAFLDRRMRELNRQGQVLAPELVSLSLEDVTVWNRVNAYATTVETWNVRVLAAGSDQVLRSDENQVSRVTYQLKWDGERWRVLSRQLRETYED